MKEIPFKTLTGQPSSLAQFDGKVLLIVNVASECAFTPQYEALDALYQRFRSKGLVVLGFPANDFGAQEPGSGDEIGKFCRARGVSFPMFEKISVLGESAHPLFQSLVQSRPATTGSTPEFRQGIAKFLAGKNMPMTSHAPGIFWNFEKFLIGRNGKVLDRFASTVEPNDPVIVNAIEAALAP